jgi:Peptidase family S41
MKRLLVAFFLLPGVNICFAQMELTHQQAMEDIDYYVRTMRASHYDPAHYISKAGYDARIKEIKSEIGDSIGLKDFVFLFYEVTALLNDAHSTPQFGQPSLQEELKKEQFFPYKLVHDKHKVYAPRPLAKAVGIPAGTEITDINGQQVSALFEQVQQRIAGLPPFRAAASERLMAYFFFLKDIKPPFVLHYKDEKGMMQQATVNTGVTLKKALSATMPHIVKPYDSDILANKLGYVDVRSLSGDIATFRSFLDTCFLNFKKAGIHDVAIDLRQNSGGNTLLGDLLFSYITNKKYQWGKKSWRISEVYKNYLKADDDTNAPYLKHPDGSIWVSGDGCLPQESPFKNDRKFEGNVFFITGSFTFSSAMAMADVVKVYKLGTIIGQPTGENVQDFGEAFVITLPHSKMRIQSTTSFSHGVNCSNTKNGPVLPDINIPTTWEEEVAEKDKVMEYLLHNIK